VRHAGGAVNGAAAARGPGRPAAATREDVLEAATYRFLGGERIDVQAIAAELGLSRMTIYRWFGSRDGLIGAVLVQGASGLFDAACARACGTGADFLLDVADHFNHSLAANPALRQFIAQERDVGLRILASDASIVRAAIIDRFTALIDEQVSAGAYHPPADPATLAYAAVRLTEAFLYYDARPGIRGDIDRLRAVLAPLLGVHDA
jgi:AcrR family transcriptional regulator